MNLIFDDNLIFATNANSSANHIYDYTFRKNMHRSRRRWKNDGTFYESIEFASFVAPSRTCRATATFENQNRNEVKITSLRTQHSCRMTDDRKTMVPSIIRTYFKRFLLTVEFARQSISVCRHCPYVRVLLIRYPPHLFGISNVRRNGNDVVNVVLLCV